MADRPNFPPDEYLTAEQVNELYDILNKQLEDLLEQGRKAVAEASEEREQEADELDIALNESNRDFQLRMADRERRLIKKIRLAMETMNEGEYGVCESCGSEITYKRLLARPVARLCIDCKTEAEQLEGRRRFF
jgi:DnaK suppressor protein